MGRRGKGRREGERERKGIKKERKVDKEETEGKERKARVQPLMDVNINISNGISQ